jgi:SNF2 family DNA or RNA helicase
VAEYAHLVDPSRVATPEQLRANKRLQHMQVIARNPDGTKRWRNLEQLQSLLAPHSFRVLKRDCLDLPEKIYQTRYFELAADQRRAYDLLREAMMLDLERDGELTRLTVSRLSALVKLQQLTSGFVMVPGETELAHLRPPGSNPRMDALLDVISDIDTPIIIWARFREELRQIAELLRESRRVVEYHGGVPSALREEAVERFQSGDADVFLGQPQSGGIGLTLTAAQTVIYFSNDFNLETRLQSEDRAHRIGTRTNVVYIDLVAVDTIDEAIVRSLQAKEDVAAAILRDVRVRRADER